MSRSLLVPLHKPHTQIWPTLIFLTTSTFSSSARSWARSFLFVATIAAQAALTKTKPFTSKASLLLLASLAGKLQRATSSSNVLSWSNAKSNFLTRKMKITCPLPWNTKEYFVEGKIRRKAKRVIAKQTAVADSNIEQSCFPQPAWDSEIIQNKCFPTNSNASWIRFLLQCIFDKPENDCNQNLKLLLDAAAIITR